MSYTTGLKYEPRMNRDVKELLDRGGLVHMLEFDMLGLSQNDIANGSIDYLENLINGFAGKRTGKTSQYKDRDSFDEKTGSFVNMATTSVKTGLPFKLFTDQSNVGFLIDPEVDTKFIYIACKDVYSKEESGNTINLRTFHMNGIVGQKILDLNVGTQGNFISREKINIPGTRSEMDEAELKSFFKNIFFRMYEGDYGTDEGKLKNFIKTVEMKDTTGLAELNEIGINFKPASVKAIVLYSDDATKERKEHKYDFAQEQIGLQGICMANLIDQMLIQKTGNGLPIIHYSHSVNEAPIINEVKVENKKIANMIEEHPLADNCYRFHLGDEYVERLILGKGDITVGGK